MLVHGDRMSSPDERFYPGRLDRISHQGMDMARLRERAPFLAPFPAAASADREPPMPDSKQTQSQFVPSSPGPMLSMLATWGFTGWINHALASSEGTGDVRRVLAAVGLFGGLLIFKARADHLDRQELEWDRARILDSVTHVEKD